MAHGQSSMHAPITASTHHSKLTWADPQIAAPTDGRAVLHPKAAPQNSHLAGAAAAAALTSGSGGAMAWKSEPASTGKFSCSRLDQRLTLSVGRKWPCRAQHGHRQQAGRQGWPQATRRGGQRRHISEHTWEAAGSTVRSCCQAPYRSSLLLSGRRQARQAQDMPVQDLELHSSASQFSQGGQSADGGLRTGHVCPQPRKGCSLWFSKHSSITASPRSSGARWAGMPGRKSRKEADGLQGRREREGCEAQPGAT
jgi:hypothetical protein